MTRIQVVFSTVFLALFTVTLLALTPTLLAMSPLDDEFDNAATLSDWTEGPVTTYDLLDIDTSTPDHLAFVPTASYHNGWFGHYMGPFRYKMITDNFAATTYVRTVNVNDHNAPPTGQYNSAGFMLRDPASDATGMQSYVMFNLGFQDTELATEGKTTINSTSVLSLTSSMGSYEGELLFCRVGSMLYLYRNLDNESDWVLTEQINRPDFPATMQLGFIVNAWLDGDLYAEFDYARFVTTGIDSQTDCVTAFDVPTAVTVAGGSTTTFPMLPLLIALLLFVGVQYSVFRRLR